VPPPRSATPSLGFGFGGSQPLLGSGTRYSAYVLLLVLGAVVGIAGCFVQALWLPGGLLLALVATAALFYGGSRLTGTRLGALVPGVGWFAAMLVAMSPRPEGDFLLTGEVASYAYLLVGALAVVICATMPTGQRR
jgi:drug/metabolite transporter superfamily protein YnfA